MIGITIKVAYIRKIGGDEGSGQILSGGSCEDDRYGKPDDRSKELDESELWYSLVEQGGSEIVLSDKMFEGN